jgi:hypothetical protein
MPSPARVATNCEACHEPRSVALPQPRGCQASTDATLGKWKRPARGVALCGVILCGVMLRGVLLCGVMARWAVLRRCSAPVRAEPPTARAVPPSTATRHCASRPMAKAAGASASSAGAARSRVPPRPPRSPASIACLNRQHLRAAHLRGRPVETMPCIPANATAARLGGRRAANRQRPLPLLRLRQRGTAREGDPSAPTGSRLGTSANPT